MDYNDLLYKYVSTHVDLMKKICDFYDEYCEEVDRHGTGSSAASRLMNKIDIGLKIVTHIGGK